MRSAGQPVKDKSLQPKRKLRGKTKEVKIGSVTAILPNHLNGEPTEITAEGRTIWGVATSQDNDLFRANLAAKTKEVCSNIDNITNPLNSLNPDVALSVLRLSPQARLQYHQQTHRHDLLYDTNQVAQRALDKAVKQIFGFDPRSPGTYSRDPANPTDPSIMPDLIALPERRKGLGLRRMDDFVGSAESIGG